MNDAEPREKSWKCLMPPYTPREASAEVAAGFAACDVSRRRFLQLLGVTVGAAAVSGALPGPVARKPKVRQRARPSPGPLHRPPWYASLRLGPRKPVASMTTSSQTSSGRRGANTCLNACLW